MFVSYSYILVSLLLLLLLLLFTKASDSNERVEYRVNNIIQNTTSNTTQVVVISVPVATTNIQLVCHSDNQTNNWNVTINSFTAESEKTYECVFNDGRVSRLSLKPTGHGVFYISNGVYGTISTDESKVKQFVLEAGLDYTAVCSGEHSLWVDRDLRAVPDCPDNGKVCQDTSGAEGSGLMFNEVAAPFEYDCRVNVDREYHIHTIQFLSVDTVIPHNIQIYTVPAFPTANNVIIVRTLFVDIVCSCDAYPLSADNYVLIFNETFTSLNTTNVTATIADHLISYDVLCEVDNGISRQETVKIIFDFSVGSPTISFTDVSSESAVLTWTAVTDHLEEYVSYRIVTPTADVTLTGAVYSYMLYGLMSCVEYEVMVIAYIEGVDDKERDSVVFTTLPQVITEAPSQLIAQSIGTRHMLLNWPIVPTTSCQSYPINYTLLYHSIYPDTSNTGELVIDSVTDNMLGSGDVFAVLSGLEEFYDYNVTVFASNRNGDGPAVSHSFKTLPTVPSNSALSLRVTQRTNLTWIPPAIADHNGVITHYEVTIRTIYAGTQGTTTITTTNTTNSYFVIQRDEDASDIEVTVRAVNQIGKGPIISLLISLNPYKELPDILNLLGEEISVEESALLLNVSLTALMSESENETTITPIQTSILVESLYKSLQGVPKPGESEEEFDTEYFQDILTASSLLWERGITRNEGQSVFPSQNFADFLGIIDFLSLLFSDYGAVNQSMSALESTNLHLKLFSIDSGEQLTTEFVEIQFRSYGMLSHVVIDNPNSRGGDDDYLRFFKTFHNFNLVSPNKDFSAKIVYNESFNAFPECVFFNMELTRWDRTGVTTRVTDTGVECVTDHFTSFGVLVRPFETQLTAEQNLALSVVTYIILSVSLVLLCVSLFLYVITYKTTFRVEANIIYCNYAVALSLATATFLFGIQTATNSYVGCFIVTVLMHYTWLCVFAWSLCIGILLFYKIWFVFNERKIWPYLIVIGWCTPAVIVAITAGTANAYYIRIGEDHCWLSRENGITWSFIGPILFVLFVNIILLVVSTIRIYTSISRYEKGKARALRISLTSAVILIPVLNTPWLLLLFTLDRSTYSVIVEWIFIFINGSNGILFFFLFVLRNNEIMKAVKSSKLLQWILGLTQKYQGEDSVARISSRYSLKKQRTTESYVEPGIKSSKFKRGSVDHDTTSPRSSIGTEFPRPMTSPPQKTNSGFVSLPTQNEDVDDVITEQTTTTGEPIYSKLVKKPKDPESGTDPGQYVPLPDGENID